MQSASLTMYKRISVLSIILVFCGSLAYAQNVNAPYSRYGLGDNVPGKNILNRAMGGLSTAYADFQSVNFFNPASYGQLQSVTYDFGAEIDNLSIRSNNPIKKYSNASPVISYVNLGIPLKKGGGWAFAFGLRPITRVNYKIRKDELLNTGTFKDSMATLYEGNGGSQQVYVGTGAKFGKFSAGVNIGYVFGSKYYGAKRIFLNDSVPYAMSNHENKANFGGLQLSGGLQYTTKLGEKNNLRFGLQGTLQSKLSATQDIVRETFNYDQNSAIYQIDSVFAANGTEGKVILPASYSAGIILDHGGQWLVGLDVNRTLWSTYRYFGAADLMRDNWNMHLGGQFIPIGGKGYWSNVAYRSGFTYGTDHVTAAGSQNTWCLSFGAGLPMRRVAYTNQFSIINAAIEVGQRGDRKSLIRENYARICIGLAMSDIWFIKRKYE